MAPHFLFIWGAYRKRAKYRGTIPQVGLIADRMRSLKGLGARARDFSNRPDNFTLRDLWMRILRWGSTDSDFGRLCYMDFLFAQDSIRGLPGGFSFRRR